MFAPDKSVRWESTCERKPNAFNPMLMDDGDDVGVDDEDYAYDGGGDDGDES